MTSKNSDAAPQKLGAVPVILEGDDPAVLRTEALRLASGWIGEERKVLAGLHVDVSVLDAGAGTAIKAEDIRAIRRDALLRPFDGSVKVYLIAYAHNMNAHAQNALLRLLEEPPSHARFVLLCQNAGMLLPTVRSRCALRRADVSAVPAAVSQEDEARAQAFIRAMDDPWERAAVAFSWDKLSRDTLKGVLRAVLACLRDKFVRDEQGDVREIDTVSQLLTALDQNASVGSVCGVLALAPPAREERYN